MTPLPCPFSIEVRTEPGQVDAFGHVNNLVYLGWIEACAWAHSAAVGLPVERCVELNQGMAVARTEIRYLRPADAGQRLTVLDWVTAAGRLRATRRFAVARGGTVLATAEVDYVCINLSSGAPVRMPPEFAAAYRVEPAVAAALGQAAGGQAG